MDGGHGGGAIRDRREVLMGKPSGRTVRGIIAAAVVSAGGIGIVACNTVLEVGDFTFDACERGDNSCECAPGQTRCAGITPQQCDRNGAWQDRELCGTDKRCLGGACVTTWTCALGDLQCDGDQPQRSNDAGEWENDGDACAPPCSECGYGTPRCARNPGSCPCAADRDCAPTEYCSADTCQRRRNIGDSCDAPNECASGFCSDKRCCDTPCSGVCQVCNQKGFEGTCRTAPAGRGGKC
ncbi:uncharacterized protein SOCE26_074260 [Sorangium cellulosum]|uniref:Disintegrin domain-containing protein n=1 Tax=Sorangium cellulosum TaxID=56 RepID=A0A2L0F2W5_SORCE|nr:uncharacterized protein SOCE26_074260 [Sorangium cellulosum]